MSRREFFLTLTVLLLVMMACAGIATASFMLVEELFVNKQRQMWFGIGLAMLSPWLIFKDALHRALKKEINRAVDKEYRDAEADTPEKAAFQEGWALGSGAANDFEHGHDPDYENWEQAYAAWVRGERSTWST